MKINKLILIFGVAISTITTAQNTENADPYSIFGKTYTLGDNAKGEENVFIIENFPEGSPVYRIEHHTGSGIVKLFDKEGRQIGEKQLSQTERAWMTPDPLAEKAYSWSPYVYVKNNPLKFIDPTGKREWPVNETYNGHSRRHENNYGTLRGNRSHKGVDINLGSGKQDLGAPVYATHEGTITRLATIGSGDTDAGGNRIQITSVNGEVSTYYMHLNTITEGLQVGSIIAEGTQIGTIGGSGNGNPARYIPHLHYELNIDGQRVNPATSPNGLIDPQVRLTPILLPEVLIKGQSPTPKLPQFGITEIRFPEIKIP